MDSLLVLGLLCLISGAIESKPHTDGVESTAPGRLQSQATDVNLTAPGPDVNLTAPGRDVNLTALGPLQSRLSGSCVREFQGRQYYLFRERLSWADAELNCVQHGLNLAAIHSPAENDFVTWMIRDCGLGVWDYVWIGLSDLHKTHFYMWSDGSKVDFSIWAPNEPNHGGSSGNSAWSEYCVHTNYPRGGGFRWNDFHCWSGERSVCKERK